MQDLAVFLIVGLAAAYLGRYWWSAAKGDGGCNGCKGKSCATNAKPAEPQLVQIDLNASFRK